MDGPFRCEASYQGLPCVVAKYRRSDGLEPEGGEVLISVDDMQGKLEIEAPEIPWVSVNGAEFDNCGDMRAWQNFKPRITTTGERPPSPEAKGGGLKLFGDLVFKTFDSKTGTLLKEQRYWAVYVDRGVELVTRELANVLKHPEGLVRVPLTDIRRYYAKYGAFHGRINCRQKNGWWDSESISPGPSSGGSRPKAYTLSQAFELLFALLPGTPKIHDSSDLYDGNDDSPQGLEGRGEPAAEHIQKLLERTGYKAQMLPDGNYAVSRKWINRLGRRSIFEDVKKPVDVDEDLHYNFDSYVYTDRPPAMMAIGGVRVQRATIGLIPVIKDPTDGRYYKLKKAAEMYGITLEDVNHQIFQTPESQFMNVKPSPEDQDSDGLHELRREAMRMAYRLYLPPFLFPDDESGVDLDRVDDLEPVMLPMVSAAWYLRDLAVVGKKVPLGEGGRGDLDDFKLVPPVIRGQYVVQGWFRNMDQVKKRFRWYRGDYNRLIGQNAVLKRDYARKKKEIALEISKAETISASTLRRAALQDYGVDDSGAIDIGGDIRKAQEEVGVVMPKDERLAATAANRGLLDLFKLYEDQEAHYQSNIEMHQAALAKIDQKFIEFQEQYKEREALLCKYNKAQGVLRPGVAAIDARTGLVTSSRPLCQVAQPFFFDGDDQTVIADGAVTVTFGYELKGSSLSSKTAFIFKAEDGGDPDKVAEVEFSGDCRSGPIKCPVVPMESRMYLEDNGSPMNYNACYSEAKGKVSGALKQRRRVPAWTMEIVGLRKAVLDGGVVSVQHIFEESGVGMTHVAVNAPGANMPLLPANAVGNRPYPMAIWRDYQQREGGQ